MAHALVRYGTIDLTSVPPRGKRLETAEQRLQLPIVMV